MESQDSTQNHPTSPDGSSQRSTSEGNTAEPGPSLGYNGTGGYNSGSDTSRDAAHDDVATGVTALAQRVTLDAAADAGPDGITIVDLRQNEILHHGKLSSALTNLHKGGRLVRLTERRDRAHVYVLPEFAGERTPAPFKPNRPQIDREELLTVIRDHRIRTADGGLWGCKSGDWTGPNFSDHSDHLADVIIAEIGR